MKIMYVEDNPANLFLVKRIARIGGHDVVNYVDGGEALDRFDGDAPDLVLMDVQLSGELNGLQVVERLRARGVTTPIIAVTAYAMVGDRERCLEAGCDDYIAKPLPIARLIEIFEAHGKRSTQSQPRFQMQDPVAALGGSVNPVPTPAPAEPTPAPVLDAPADDGTETLEVEMPTELKPPQPSPDENAPESVADSAEQDKKNSGVS